MELNLTEKERKKALQRLYGKVPGRAVVLMISLVIEIIIFVGIICIILLVPEMNLAEYNINVIFMSFMLVVYGLLIMWMGLMMADYYKHSKYLQEKYEALPSWRKQKLLYLAHNYKISYGICMDEDYIYGMMSEAKRGKEKFPHVEVFLYIDMKELAWAYRVENYAAVSSLHSVGNETSYIKENELRFFKEDGTRFKGKSRYTNEEALFRTIQKVSPKCRLGYKKEWAKEWKKRM